MSWFSFLRKNKLEPAPDESEFYSHAEDIPAKTRGRSKAKETMVDPVLPEKKRARRRLVGAVAIALALIITLPMLLDAEPKSRADEIVIQIPSRDKPSKLAANRLPASTASPPISASPPASTSSDAAVTAPAAPEKAAKPAAAESKPIPAPVKVTPAAAQSVKPEPKKEVKPSANAAPGKFVVQVAALATQEAVNTLRAKLSKAGLKSHTQKVATQGGDRTRVRLGPFASKAEAEKVCPKLSKINLKCTVLAH